MKVLFSVLRYQLLTDEFMNIGILFHNLDTDERKLETISKWKRLKNFDDELDLVIFKILISGIKEEIKNTLLNKNTNFDIYEYHKRYVNELRFSEIYNVEIDDFNKYVEESKKHFLRYDYEKKERPGKKEQLDYIKSLVKGNSKPIKGRFSENITFDYIVGEYAFKLFSFEDKDLSRVINSAKLWSYIACELKEQYKTVFLYDKIVKNNEFDIIIKILKEHAYEVMKYDELLEIIPKLNADIKLNI